MRFGTQKKKKRNLFDLTPLIFFPFSHRYSLNKETSENCHAFNNSNTCCSLFHSYGFLHLSIITYLNYQWEEVLRFTFLTLNLDHSLSEVPFDHRYKSFTLAYVENAPKDLSIVEQAIRSHKTSVQASLIK